MCAALCAQRGHKVAVLERTSKVGKKILMSGGGRCNFTNLDVSPENYLSRNPHFCKSALSRYTQWDFIGLVGDYDIPYHEKSLGQLFCDNTAKDILSMLLSECEKNAVDIITHCDIAALSATEPAYRLQTNKGDFEAGVCVVATGGLSIPTMGVTGFGYELAQQFGMKILPTHAGLVPFTLGEPLKTLASQLSGLSVDAHIGHQDIGFRENILFTHRGLSGPAVLQISSYWQVGGKGNVVIDLFPETEMTQWLLDQKKEQPKAMLRTLLNKSLPKKLVLALENQWWQAVANTPIAEYTNTQLAKIAEHFNHWTIKPSGTEGYRTAEVTLGGVDTDGLSSKTMESKSQSGLFFIGEVVDVTGHLGGYNFQWAWSSAYAAAQAI
ncbi:MAG: NAD(P)/FAD-dependent oxidoreductase [Pseudomonadales bacterium]|nr:NAD(P)/FAD-dependent oxidoreductase [Pseudomonadales bacterium]